MTRDHEYFMRLALEQGALARARGNPPIGAIMVRDGEVVGVGHNVVVSGSDPTGHAEVQAIRDASQRLRTSDLSGCACYTAMEPCPMCAWALVEARVARLVLGARHAGMRRFPVPRRTDYGDYSVEGLLVLAGREMDIVTGVLETECEDNRANWRPPSTHGRSDAEPPARRSQSDP